jgi:hypothetical protein
MEQTIQANPALTAGQLERVSRTQDLLVDLVRERISRHDPTDPRPAAIVGAALPCLIAAKTTWVVSDKRDRSATCSTTPWEHSSRHRPQPSSSGPQA